MLQAIYSAFERLLAAEGDRRRVRIELHEPDPEVKRLDWVTERLASLSKVNCRSASFRVDLAKSPQGKGWPTGGL
ncbi:hypothetical protein [Streptomyces griseoloalbus]|uniref:phage terminase small subunit n=1 Tax=Streptomyces TaxID=1883 RepID=UPI0019C712F2|nr:hypothetical protein GCM10010294_31290 [Streptomyces griseoloalbus]